MSITTNPKTVADITPAIKSAVAAVLLAQAFAQLEREKMDRVDRELLAGHAYMVRPEFQERRGAERITEPRMAYLMSDEDSVGYYEDRQKEIDAMGYKMPKGHCPACVAECVLIDAQRILVSAAETLHGITWDNVTSKPGMLEKYTGLLIGLVVNLPDFRNPLTGKAA